MKIEELKKLKEVIFLSEFTTTFCVKIRDLINTEIARQSVKGEDVQRAIESLHQQKMSIEAQEWEPEEEQSRLDALDLAITALEHMRSWIPVTERLPEKTTRCLLLCCRGRNKSRNDIVSGFYVTAGDPHWEADDWRPPRVTHWMPLPEFPEVEE